MLAAASRFELDREGQRLARGDHEVLEAARQGILAQAQALAGVGDVHASGQGPGALGAETLDPAGRTAAAAGGIDHEVAVQLTAVTAAHRDTGDPVALVVGEQSAHRALAGGDRRQSEHAAADHPFEHWPGEREGARLLDIVLRVPEPLLAARGEQLLAQAGQQLLHRGLAEGEQTVHHPALGHAATRCERLGVLGAQLVAVDDGDLLELLGETGRGEQPGHPSAHDDRVVQCHGPPS